MENQTTNADEANQPILKRATAALLELHITRKNMLIYPVSHEQVQRSLKSAHERIGHAMELITPLTYLVSAEALLVGTKALSFKLSAIRETANMLRRYGVVSLCFSQPLTKKNLGRFIALLTTDVEKIRYQGGIAGEITRQQITGVCVRMIDYSRLRVTEESEIQRADSHKPNMSAWQRFTSRSLNSADGLDMPTSAASDPARLAGLLNAGEIDAQNAVKFFGEAIAEITASESSGAPESRTREDLTAFIHLVRQIGPELQQSFLFTAFNEFSTQPPGEAAGRFIAALGPPQIYRALVLARNRGQQISPSLVAFLKKMGHFQPRHSSGAFPDDAALKALLEREDYETYVDNDYDQLLHELGSEELDKFHGTPENRQAIATLQRELSESLEKSSIDILVVNALMRLMDVSERVEDYRDWARQLTFLLDDLVGNEEFATLSIVYDFMLKEQNRAVDPDKQKIIAMVLNRFEETQFISRAVQAADRALHEVKEESLIFLARLGEPVVVEILDRIGADCRLDANSGIYAIMQCTAPLVIQEAQDRLSDPRPAYVCFMLQVIRCFWSNQNIDGVKTLLDHQNVEIRMEALATLLSLNNAWGILRLRELIIDSWSPITRRAIELSGAYRIREVVSLLLSMVERRGRLGLDLERRIAALQALGRIGDPQVLPHLTRLARRNGLFAGKHLRRLKHALFESLADYPYSDARDLLHFGLKNKDAVIQASCKRIIRKQHPDNTLLRAEQLKT